MDKLSSPQVAYFDSNLMSRLSSQVKSTDSVAIANLSSKMNETVFDEKDTANGKQVKRGEVSSAVAALGAFLQVLPAVYILYLCFPFQYAIKNSYIPKTTLT